MTAKVDEKIGGLLLAAGGSSRFGSPKQLVKLENKTLIRRASEALAGSKCEPVVVVLGAELERSRAEIADLPLNVFVNKQWRSGMSSSIRSGLAEMLRIEPDLSAAVITLCDQPFVTSDVIDQLIGEFRTAGSAIVATAYQETVGVPAVFGREFFAELAALIGDRGAKGLIRSNAQIVTTVKIENAAVDIDTTEDLMQAER